MNYSEVPASLEKLSTPIIICDERGQVIFKNTAAVKSVRLPRRNTSMLTHLGQTERGELMRLGERRKPSVLTVQTGDRNARALVTVYERGGKPCSLWIFASLLQTGSVSGMFAEMDAQLISLGKDICDYVKTVDLLALQLPEEKTNAQFERLDKALRRIVEGLVEHRRGWQFELGDVMDMLRECIERPMRKYGYQLNYSEAFGRIAPWDAGRGDYRLLIELHTFFSLYLHLILFVCELAPMRQLDVFVYKEEQGGERAYYMDVTFTLPYPPFYTEDYSDDLNALTVLSPKNRFEIMLFEAFSKACGYHMTYRITHGAVGNMIFRTKLPIYQKLRLRSGEESNTERLFVQHDLALYFWHIVQERLSEKNE